jgi:hypothetical protein
VNERALQVGVQRGLLRDGFIVVQLAQRFAGVGGCTVGRCLVRRQLKPGAVM